MDMEELAADVAEAVREHVGPLKAQIAALVAEVAELRARAPIHGKDGAPGKDGDPGPRGAPGADGRNGVDGQKGDKGESGEDATVDMIELAAILRREPEFVAMCKGDPGKDGPQGVPGRDGLHGRDGKDGDKGAQGDRGFDGENGRDGRDGTKGDRGADGKDGAPGERGDPGIQGKDGNPGRDGFSLEDFEASTPDGGRTIVLSFASGELRRSFELRTAVILDRGGYKPSEGYLKGDAVTYGGQIFIAQKDCIGSKPGNGPDWRLAVRRGADSKGAE